MNRLVVVAEHSVVVHAIRLALRQTAGFQISAFLDGRTSVRAQLLDVEADVVVVDDMGDPARAVERLQEVSEVLPGAKALLLAEQMVDDVLENAFDAGAEAVISKSLHPVAIGTLLRETVRGSVVHRPRPPRSAEEDCPLTGREAQILGLAAQGYTNGRIARQLWITEQTVKFHLSNTYRKLGVANRTEASRYAYVNDLVTQQEPLAS